MSTSTKSSQRLLKGIDPQRIEALFAKIDSSLKNYGFKTSFIRRLDAGFLCLYILSDDEKTSLGELKYAEDDDYITTNPIWRVEWYTNLKRLGKEGYKLCYKHDTGGLDRINDFLSILINRTYPGEKKAKRDYERYLIELESEPE